MADNWLERKEAALRSGQTVVRRVNPSLDTLLGRVRDKGITDPEYIVKQAQLDAMVRSAAMLGVDFEAEISEERREIRIHPSESSILIGTVILAMQLKAAELGLKTEVRSLGKDALITIFK